VVVNILTKSIDGVIFYGTPCNHQLRMIWKIVVHQHNTPTLSVSEQSESTRTEHDDCVFSLAANRHVIFSLSTITTTCIPMIKYKNEFHHLKICDS